MGQIATNFIKHYVDMSLGNHVVSHIDGKCMDCCNIKEGYIDNMYLTAVSFQMVIPLLGIFPTDKLV